MFTRDLLAGITRAIRDSRPTAPFRASPYPYRSKFVKINGPSDHQKPCGDEFVSPPSGTGEPATGDDPGAFVANVVATLRRVAEVIDLQGKVNQLPASCRHDSVGAIGDTTCRLPAGRVVLFLRVVHSQVERAIRTSACEIPSYNNNRVLRVRSKPVDYYKSRLGQAGAVVSSQRCRECAL
jgi:hypothetical protein